MSLCQGYLFLNAIDQLKHLKNLQKCKGHQRESVRKCQIKNLIIYENVH